MRKFELTITPDYANDWTLIDGVRELFQNALDQQEMNPDCPMYVDYSPEEECLRIGNANSRLEIQSLLFGESTKRDNDRAIGQFGEGYKIATLVLLRSGKGIKFYNNAANEIWEPRFVNSRIYGKKILTFFINKGEKNNRTDLMAEITGITPKEYERIVDSNLHLQESEPDSVYENDFGYILRTRKNAGKIFVNGLFVCDYIQYQYGYDFKPAYLKLGRDRKLVSDWDLKWLSSKMWRAAPPLALPELKKLIESESPDVASYDSVINYTYASFGNEDQLAELVYEQFREDHGEFAVPVSSQAEMTKISERYKPVIVKDLYKKLIQKAKSYNLEEVYIPQESIVDKFNKLYSSLQEKLTLQECIQFENCISKLKELAVKLDD